MNKPEKNEEDFLSRYISPEKIEKAPEGFTQRTMTRIQSEKTPAILMARSLKKYRVPVFYTMITIVLTITAFIITPSSSLNLDMFLTKMLGEIHFPVFNTDKIFSFTLPELLIYISLGIFLLLLFDQVLGRFFNRERK